MNIACNDRERIFLDGTPEEWAALEAHASNCAACREEVAAWKNLSVAATELAQEWDSAYLWPRIERALAEQSASTKTSWWARVLGSWNLTSLEWQTAAAALLLVLVSVAALRVIYSPEPRLDDRPLISDETLRRVLKTQAAYEQAID